MNWFKNLVNWQKFLPDLDVQAKLTLSIILSASGGILIGLSLMNLAGEFGGVVAAFLEVLLGKTTFLVPFIFFYISAIFYKLQKDTTLNGEINSRLLWGFFLMLGTINGFLNIFFDVNVASKMDIGGGLVGYIFYPTLLSPFGKIGASVLLLSNGFFGFFLISQLSFVEFWQILKNSIKNPDQFWKLIPDVFEIFKTVEKTVETDPKSLESLDVIIKDPIENNKTTEAVNTKSENSEKPNPEDLRKELIEKMENQTSHKNHINTNKNTDWKRPAFELLKDNHTTSEPGDIEGNKTIIKQTLEHFNITVEMNEVVSGPTVSQYTFKPASGVKLSTIDGLQRDLALALAANSIRLEAPIPGKSLVGVEIPNKIKSEVRLKEVLQTNKFINSTSPLPVAIGVDVAGKPIVASIAKTPHLLVAGATGSGKSIWINSMLLSLLYRYSPKDLQLILVDMKRVELKLYDKIPHLLAPVITDSEKAINALKWAILEMDKRYKLLEEYGKRNILDFNEFLKTTNLKKLPIVANPNSDADEKLLELQNLQELPYLVFVIDELGDLMMLAKNEVEPIIVRLTQMSRAVGIHLVLGTQRPDTHVVTGLIKANVPTRVAFTVASQIDSRVILDQGGAEKLLGQGDGLFMSQDSIKPVRFQGCFVEESEVRKVVSFWHEQATEKNLETNFNPDILEPPRTRLNVPGMQQKDDFDGEDDLYSKIRKYVINQQSASTSMLQTAFGIGYPKARKLIEQLEEEGIVGPPNGSKPREVYIFPE
jgi:DNA segregation ATPase FtsK/SpoIIIE, S-DNA-T family